MEKMGLRGLVQYSYFFYLASYRKKALFVFSSWVERSCVFIANVKETVHHSFDFCFYLVFCLISFDFSLCITPEKENEWIPSRALKLFMKAKNIICRTILMHYSTWWWRHTHDCREKARGWANRQLFLFMFQVIYICCITKMWNVARIRIYLAHMQKTFFFSWHMDVITSAGARCIWTVCFVSFVLNWGSVLLSGSHTHKQKTTHMTK